MIIIIIMKSNDKKNVMLACSFTIDFSICCQMTLTKIFSLTMFDIPEKRRIANTGILSDQTHIFVVANTSYTIPCLYYVYVQSFPFPFVLMSPFAKCFPVIFPLSPRLHRSNHKHSKYDSESVCANDIVLSFSLCLSLFTSIHISALSSGISWQSFSCVPC